MPDSMKPDSVSDEWSDALVPSGPAPAPAVLAGHSEHHHTMPHGMSTARLLQHKWLGLAVFLVVAVPVIGVVIFTHVPVYEARATIEVSPTVENIVSDPTSVPRYRQYLNDQAALIQSDRILQRVLDQAPVRETEWFKSAAALNGSRLHGMRSALSVSPRSNTSLIDISMSAESPSEATLIANAVMDEYLSEVYGRANETGNIRLSRIEDELKTLRGNIDDLRAGITAQRADAGHWSPEQLLAQQRMRLDQRQVEREAIRNRITIATWRLDQLKARQERLANPEDASTTQPSELEDILPPPPYEADPEWRRLNLACQSAKDAIELETHLGDEHPRMVKLRTAEQQAEAKLRTHEQQLDVAWSVAPPTSGDATVAGGVPQPTEHDLRELIALTQEELKLQEAAIRDEEERVQRSAKIAARLQERLNELAHFEQRYEELRDRKVTMVMESRAPASIRAFDRAMVRPEPVNTRTRLMMIAAALFGSLFLGVGAAYVRARAATAIQDFDEMAFTKAPFLGFIPIVRSPELAESAVRAEHIRMVRTALLQRLATGHGKTIQITSAGPGAGKSTLAVLLADSLARCGKKVLLVDGDLRNPSLHERCQIKAEPGLIDVLRARASDAEAITAMTGSGIAILPAGHMQGAADAELLANGVLSRVVQRWSDQFDIILFDSAPLLPVADARILATQVSGTLMVVRQKHCHRADVSDAMRQLTMSGATVMGMVFVGERRYGTYRNAYYAEGYYGTGTDHLALDAREV